MITKREAQTKVHDLLLIRGADIKGGLAIIEEKTLAKAYGWIFFYNSRLFLETRDILHAIAGNGPVVVIADSGELVMLGTALPAAQEIEAFELRRNLHG